ncbi:MAG: exonuclease domain-containing protein [Eubacterium sp.]|nr:exonuclease domain-containing protein [Eubacterium sp.]
MNYIVFDLEWNQSPNGRAGEHPRMPFEIIEIGAVRLDEKLNMTGEFHKLIKPKLYPKFHKYIKAILNYDEKELKEKGVPFKEACTEFIQWCEEESEDGYIFCSWGPSDLSYLQNNMDFYYMQKLPYPLKFYDIQQIYAEKYSKDKSVCKLEKAVTRLKLKQDRPFHLAINDAYYTARIMQEGKLGQIADKYVYDTYRYPRKRSESIHDFHNGIFEEIYGEYKSKHEALKDSRITDIRCVKCGKLTTSQVKTFHVNNNTVISVGSCPKHGRMLSTVKFKSASESKDTLFAVKKIVAINKNKYTDVVKRKDQLAQKKRERDSRNLTKKPIRRTGFVDE